MKAFGNKRWFQSDWDQIAELRLRSETKGLTFFVVVTREVAGILRSKKLLNVYTENVDPTLYYDPASLINAVLAPVRLTFVKTVAGHCPLQVLAGIPKPCFIVNDGAFRFPLDAGPWAGPMDDGVWVSRAASGEFAVQV
jgi:hypothetical protein